MQSPLQCERCQQHQWRSDDCYRHSQCSVFDPPRQSIGISGKVLPKVHDTCLQNVSLGRCCVRGRTFRRSFKQQKAPLSHAQKITPFAVGCQMTAVTALSSTSWYKRVPSDTLHIISRLSSPPLARYTPHGEKARVLMLSVCP